MRTIKIGDKVTVNLPLVLLLQWGITGLTHGKEYEVLGVGKEPTGWPENCNHLPDDVYFLCDDGLYTQLDDADVTLVE